MIQCLKKNRISQLDWITVRMRSQSDPIDLTKTRLFSLSLLKPASHIQDCQEDCVTTANRGAILRKCQDYWSFKTASRQFSDGSKTALRWVRQCCDGVATASRIKKNSKFNVFFLLRQSYDGQDSVTTCS